MRITRPLDTQLVKIVPVPRFLWLLHFLSFPLPPANRDFTIYDSDVDENVTSKYNFALS